MLLKNLIINLFLIELINTFFCSDPGYAEDRQGPVRRDNWYRDDWVNRQNDWGYDGGPHSGYRSDTDHGGHIRRMRTPSPQRTQPWPDQQAAHGGVHAGSTGAIAGQGGGPGPVDSGGYYPIGNGSTQQPNGGQRNPMLGAMFQNRSLDRSAIFGTGARNGLNHYLSETGRNWSQPSLAINRLVGAATGGRRLPQPPPEAQKPFAMPLPNTPLPMNQKPVALSFRNR